MTNFIKQFSSKKFKYGAFSSIMTLAVIAILVLVNLVAGQFNVTFDVTAERLYSISDKTKDILRGLTEDITIYTLYKTGTETDGYNYMHRQILQEYADTTSRIKIVNRDPYLYPQFVDGFAKSGEKIPVNSLIVTSGERGRVIPEDDLYTYNPGTSQLASFNIEPQVTNAIKYVITDHIFHICVMEGHGEIPLADSLSNQLTLSGYDISSVDLTKEDMPEDCAVFIATQPLSDWSENEARKVTDFLQNNGKALFIIGYSSKDLSNFKKVLNPYGVQPGEHLVFEGNTANYTADTPVMLLPNYTGAEAISVLASGPNRMILYMTAAVAGTSDPVSNTVKVEPLLVTSSQAYEKTDMNTETLAMEPGDNPGPFNLAVAITDRYSSGSTDYVTKLVYCPSYAILEENINSICRNANWDFIVQSVNWLQGKSSGMSVYIQAKAASTSVGYLYDMKQSDANMIAGVCAVGIPTAVIVAGLIWWLRRRYS